MNNRFKTWQPSIKGAGFTRVEMLVVVAIIGLLAARLSARAMGAVSASGKVTGT